MIDPAKRQKINDFADEVYDQLSAAFVKSVNAHAKTWLVAGVIVPWAIVIIGAFTLVR